MNKHLRAAVAASMILGGSAGLASAAWADEPHAGDPSATPAPVAIDQLERDLARRAHKDAEAIAADAMLAATDLHLDMRPVGPISVVMAGDL